MAARDNEKKSRIARDFRRVLIVLVIIFVAILGRQEYKIYQIQKEAEATQKRVEELQKAQADLEAERKRLYDPKYIEKLAREDHNYVKKDEVPIFIVKDKDKQNAEPKQNDQKEKQEKVESNQKKAEN
jgi:cell division protein FtsL